MRIAFWLSEHPTLTIIFAEGEFLSRFIFLPGMLTITEESLEEAGNFLRENGGGTPAHILSGFQEHNLYTPWHEQHTF